MESDTSTALSRLIERLDRDTAQDSPDAICAAVKATLIDEISQRSFELPAELTAICATGYARRLLHKTERYAVVIMTWDAGQGTPIHDHDGKWCVECVYEGEITVRSYDLLGDPANDVVGFRESDVVTAGRGAAGALIPPFDYHVIVNETNEPAVTVHVYGGEMHGCHVFEPTDDGRFLRQHRALSYTD